MVELTLTRSESNKRETVELDRMLASWMRHLRGAKSPATMRAYGYAVRGLTRYLVDQGMPTEPAWITTEHVDAYLDHEYQANSPATARLRRTYLNVFFNWLLAEGEIKSNPVKRTKIHSVTDRPPDVLRDDAWAALLRTCNGNTLDDRRDTALLMVLEASGLRRSECAALRVRDVDLDEGRIIVLHGKGDRHRIAPLDANAAKAIDRYLRKRPDGGKNPDAPLWLARGGSQMTSDGIAGVVRRRGAQAGLSVHAHQLRHRFADSMKRAGMSEESLMALGGWRSRDVMARYARATTSERALESYQKIRDGS